jgi:heme oxygenase
VVRARPQNPLLDRLRTETGPAHASTERRIADAGRIGDVDAYRRLLVALHPIYAAVEARLEAFDEWSQLEPPIDLRSRRRAHLLAADLRALAVAESAGGANASRGPSLPGFAHALGALYVVEGSRLGGRVLARQIAARVGGSVWSALGFLRSDGSDVGRLWKELCEALRGFGAGADRGSCDGVVAGALATFGSFEWQLAGWEP